MSPQAINEQWQQISTAVLSEIGQWRVQHPQATWREIEQAVDGYLKRLRSRVLQDTAQQSAKRQWTELPTEQRPLCPDCHQGLLSRGSRTRTLQSNGAASIPLERSYGTCPQCGGGFFPPRRGIGLR